MSPMLTVVVLTVLWLIVVVPMILRRNDELARERSVQRFGRAMRALSRRDTAAGRPAKAQPADPDDATYVMPRVVGPRAEVFVTGAARPDDGTDELAVASRRPVPAAQEALMYPADRSDMSDARRAMMARRRRSLTVLGVGTVVTVALALVIGGASWVLALLFVAGLAGYLMFLRNQATKDRERRATRQLRAVQRRPRDYDATAPVRAPRLAPPPDSIVRIDDDDIELHNLDTVDLTGLYNENYEPAAVRRAG